MAYVITQACCNDASCVPVCPVNCIHPTPDEPQFATTEMLYIEPDVCIDCGACLDECPVSAIFPDDALPAQLGRYAEINENYYRKYPLDPTLPPYVPEVPLRTDLGTLRVAIVGSGPAAMYAARDLLSHSNVEVEVFDRLPTPYGLVRAGVAPDHPGTKMVADMFRWTVAKPAFRFHLNVEIGNHLSHEDLMEYHHAVIYAVGASADRHLNIPGEELPGSHAATEFVAWYNGHPDYADRTFDLSSERVVIVGNGNVALDVARILTLDPELLARTDIADYALDALKESKVREVVLLGRRGPAQAAYSVPEFLALGSLPGVDVVIDPDEARLDELSQKAVEESPQPLAQYKVQLAYEFADASAKHPPDESRRKIVFRYRVSPQEILGNDRVTGLRAVRNELVSGPNGLHAQPTDETEDIETSLVLRSVGYRGTALPGLPFDEKGGTIPNDRGRILDAPGGQQIPGVYVAGWIKRGPTGVIGTNKTDAEETVQQIIDDFNSEKLQRPVHTRDELARLVSERQPAAVDLRGWRSIDDKETSAGRKAGRPRVKLVAVSEMLEAGRKRGVFERK
ncbi:FAD-dependent oxidoreductase [Hoyosella subflava]|uniref:ferredoxin--NADP(+) reductase n=1 Tax=Hoyosella subflava (strain DSM 45089 / JCM 17490 / NBRC 109087 / DQS3-9A1) TaxID=443218 RepID=F6EH17_HOYSD|nr:FAD-dependent oxidoreductase [Hoyosella subflava]AEF38841.1 Ferredoxin-NADP reductase [Hoyosella subflava DQS3-9A1]